MTSYALDFVTCDKWLNSSGPSNDTEVWGTLVRSLFKWNSNSSAHLPGTVCFHFQNDYARPRQKIVGKSGRKMSSLLFYSSPSLPLSLSPSLPPSPPMPLFHSFSFLLTPYRNPTNRHLLLVSFEGSEAWRRPFWGPTHVFKAQAFALIHLPIIF